MGETSAVVVTGATGHIGNVLVRELLSRDENVRVLIPPFEDTASLDGLKVEKVEGDVLKVDSLVGAFREADVVYHLAGIVSILPGKSDLLYQVNVAGTRNVAEACLKSGVRRLVYTSSIHAIAQPPHGTVTDETLPFDPDSSAGEYDRSKARATLEVLKVVEQGLDARVVCPTGVIGPYDFRPSEMGQLFRDFAKGKLKAYIDGAHDFVDVRDVALGHILACQKGRSGESYILSGERIAIDDLMSMLEEITGVRAPRVKIPIWLAETVATFSPLYHRLTETRPLFTKYSIRTLTSSSVVSREKSRRELGYSPRPIRESVADTLRWFEEKGML